MKPPKWPRAPPTPSPPSGSPATFRPTWAHRKHGVSPPSVASPKPTAVPTRHQAAPKLPTDFSQLRLRRAPQIDEDAISRKRQEWPLLKRRGTEAENVTQSSDSLEATSPFDAMRSERRDGTQENLESVDASAFDIIKPIRRDITHGSSNHTGSSAFNIIKPRRRQRTQETKYASNEDDLADLLQRTGSTKAEWVAKKGPTPRFARAEIDWSKLEAAKPRQDDVQSNREGLTDDEIRMQAVLDADSKKHMLLIRGVSTNLSATDFHRIAPKSLANWSSSIKRVEQQRHPQTFRPLGCYQVSFISSTAADSYLANLTRLQRLAQHKMSSRTGLWQATVPSHLLRANSRGTPEDIERDLQALTLLSPSQRSLHVKKTRTITKYQWAREVETLTKNCGFGQRPPVVVMSVVPGLISESALANLIQEDGLRRDLAWKASSPISITKKSRPTHLSEKGHLMEDESEQDDVVNGDELGEMPDAAEARFVLAFESEWEARSFYRSWHQRVLTTERDGREDRALAQVDVLEW